MKIMQTLIAAVIAFFMAMPFAHAQVETKATSAIIVDADTGTVLLDKQANKRMPTSSMSKVMTAYMVFEDLKRGHIQLSEKVTISEKAWRMQGSKMFIRVGTKVTFEDLIRGLVIQSGNDAAVALAEGVAGTEQAFVDAMNIRAQELGMENSHFKNASGWPDPDHYSTPRDLAILAFRIISDFPEYYGYFSETEFTYNKIKQQNRDPLLGHVSGADGLKTGHTEAAGYGLMGSAIREGRRVILVINGLDSAKERKEEGVRLIEWAFRNFESKTLVSKNQLIEQAAVWLGKSEQVPLVAAEDLKVLLPRGKHKGVEMSVSYQGPLKAPIQKGDTVGRLFVRVPDQPQQEINLLAGETVPRKGMFGRAVDRLGYLITGDY